MVNPITMRMTLTLSPAEGKGMVYKVSFRTGHHTDYVKIYRHDGKHEESGDPEGGGECEVGGGEGICLNSLIYQGDGDLR